MDRREYPRWEAVTTTVKSIEDLEAIDISEALNNIYKRGEELFQEAMEYAQCWPSEYRGFGASFYETYGPNIAEMLRARLEADPDFGRVMVEAEYNNG